MSHCIAILKVMFLDSPEEKGVVTEAPLCTVRVGKGLREGANPCKTPSLTCLQLGVSVVYLHSCISSLLYFRILEVLSKALFHLVLVIQ